MTFEQFGLTEALARAVRESGYTVPTPIQAQAIPVVLAGGDLLAAAQTGTGKTAAFTLPILQRLQGTEAPRRNGRVLPRVLVLAPTRELAAQVADSVRRYGTHTAVRAMAMFGGVGMQPQLDALARGVDIVVATPGRLLDHLARRSLDLSAIEILVLDEADRMLDMGFINDMKKIFALLPKARQTLLFSATFSDAIRALTDKLLKNPQRIDVAPRNATAATVSHTMHPVPQSRKRDLLVHLIEDQRWTQALVFTRTKHGANRLVTQLDAAGIQTLAIHGNKSQNARTKALADFKSGKLQVLVATDIAARGIDINELPVVVNYELPNVPEDYVHRIGRTGRAGLSGRAVSLVCSEENAYLRDIERLIGRGIERVLIPGFETPARAEPVAPAPARRHAKPGHARGNQAHHASPGKQAAHPAAPAAPHRRKRGGRGGGGGSGRAVR
ncbi:MAG: DEAD/DEAH box helicase [Metallibacterium scheffleri]|jgi:ATP-dependent RNA helicase RhlE